MTDTYSPEVRSRVMARVKARDTAPEMALRRALYRAGVRGWRCHRSNLPGKPDLAFGRVRLAVFVDGGFWHGHPSKYWPGRSGGYWDAKIARNQARDRKADRDLAGAGGPACVFGTLRLKVTLTARLVACFGSFASWKQQRRGVRGRSLVEEPSGGGPCAVTLSDYSVLLGEGASFGHMAALREVAGERERSAKGGECRQSG